MSSNPSIDDQTIQFSNLNNEHHHFLFNIKNYIDAKFQKNNMQFPVNLTNTNKLYFMKKACFENNVDQFLMFANDIDLTTEDNILFRIALERGFIDIIKLLIEFNVDYTFDNNYAIKRSVRYAEILKYFIDLGANISIDNDLPLRYAIFLDQLESIKLLVENGADMYVLNNSPIKIAIYYKDTNCIKYFIEQGMDVQIEDNCIFRYMYNKESINEFLLQSGADPNSLNGDNWTDLILNGRIETIRLLIKYGADIDLLNNKYRSLSKNMAEIVQILTQNGMEITTLINILLSN